MSNMDGGRTALAGYLYQIVGVLGMVGRAYCPDQEEELQALLRVVREGELLHEYLDQDAVLRRLGIDGNDECVLVQFKFSRQLTPPTIGPQALMEIVKQLIISERSAKRLAQSVTGYVLITNREISAKSEEVIQAAKKKSEHQQIKTLPKTKKYDTITKDEQCEVLEQLRLITDIPQARWYNALQQFGRQYGAEDDEIEDGVDTLIGRLVRQTAEKGFCKVVKADLIEALVGHREARPLTSQATLEYTQKQLSYFFDHLGLLDTPVPRKVLDEINAATFEQALVILHGRGGCGKTVSLWDWLQELPTNLKVMQVANSVRSSWITELICRWCNLPPNHARRSESIERALARLQIANPETLPPILFLGLDGLDEKMGDIEKTRVRDILHWFWEEDKRWQDLGQLPRATLVVTCRDAKKVLNDLLQLERSAFAYRGEYPVTIIVDDFSWNELLRAVKIGQPELFERVQALIQADSISNNAVPSSEPKVLSSLRHPAMWRALLELDTQTQDAVLDGKVDAVHQLAHVFVVWFCKKAIIRGASNLEVEHLFLILKDIACYNKNSIQSSQTNREWIEPAYASGMLNDQEAKQLLSEAVWAGLIEREKDGHWCWRHELVRDYLVMVEIH